MQGTEWPGEPLRPLVVDHGLRRSEQAPPEAEAGISAFRWVLDPQELLPVLGVGRRQYVQIANSWRPA